VFCRVEYNFPYVEYGQIPIYFGHSPFTSTIQKQEKAIYSVVIITSVLLITSTKLLLQVTVACLNYLVFCLEAAFCS